MKKLLFAIAFMTAGSVAVLAQEAQPKEQEPQTPPTSELPANIQAALQGQDYSGWTVASAFKKEKDGKTFYSVDLTKDQEKKIINFDADGNVMKDEEKPKN